MVCYQNNVIFVFKSRFVALIRATMPGSPAGLPTEITTLPQALPREYTSKMTGKWHLGHTMVIQTPVGRGFSEFKGIQRIIS